jgi:hypothetical protein
MMREKIARYLKEQRTLLENEWITELQAHWKSRMVADSLSCSRGAVREPCQHSCERHEHRELPADFVRVFYDALLNEIEGTKATRSHSKEFAHFTEQGTRITLPYLMETSFAGEDVFLRHFSSGGNRVEGCAMLELIRDALQSVTVRESHQFCGECVAPLSRSIQELLTESKRCENCSSHQHHENCTHSH